MNKNRKRSPFQREAVELNWLLYITEGYSANLAHALAVNAYTLDTKSLRLMKQIQEGADGSARLIREAIDAGVEKRHKKPQAKAAPKRSDFTNLTLVA